MKRAISFLISLIILVSFIVPASAEEDVQLSRAERFALGAGFIDSQNYNAGDEVTRAEFAAVLVRMLRIFDADYSYMQWKDNTEGNVQSAEDMFDDVDASHPYYYEVQLAGQKNLMSGISETQFAPEYSITQREAVKVLLDILGWGVIAEQKGGYPKGYEAAAASSGLIKSADFSAALNKKKLASLIFDMLDIKIIEVSDYSGAEYKTGSETFLTGILNGGRIKGIVSDNGFTSIDGKSRIAVDEITVGNVSAKLPEGMNYAKEYIGMQADMYYTNDDSGDSTVLYIEKNDNGEINIDIKDFESYRGGVISYKEGGSRKTKTLDKNADMILNNEFCESFDESVFDFDSGDITLLKDEQGKYSLIVVNKYEFALVGNLNTNQKYVYNKLKGSKVTGIYDFSGGEVDSSCIFISDEAGNNIEFSEIRLNDVLNIRKSNNYMNVVKSNAIVSDFTVTGRESDDDSGTFISGADGKYRLTKTFEGSSNRIVYYTGKPYTLYLTMFGDVLWMDTNTQSVTGEHIGVLTDVRKLDDAENEDESRFVRIFGDDGKLARYWSDEKLSYNNRRVKFDEIADVLKEAVGSSVIYTIDENSKISAICTAKDFGNTEQTGWYRLAPTDTMYYGGQGGDLGNIFYIDKNETLRFTVPIDKSDYVLEDNFSLNAVSFQDNAQYTIEAYAKKRSSVTADAIIIRQNATSAGTTKEGEAFFIQKIVDTINEDNEPILLFKGYTFGISGNKAATYQEFTVAPDAIMIGFGGTAEKIPADGDINEVGPRTYRELSAGDIINYNLNIRNEIDSIRIAYDYSTGKAFDCGRGSDQYAPENAGKHAVAVNSTFAGGAISVDGNGLRLAVCGNPAFVNFANFESVKRNVKAFILKNQNAIIVADMSGRSVEVRSGTPEDIVTYENSGVYDTVVVMTYWSSGHYGTVIYK